MREGRCVEARYHAWVITSLMGLVVLIWSAGVLAMLVSVVLGDAPPTILGGASVGVIAIAGFVWLIRRRIRTMGRFELDFEAGTLSKLGRVRGRWSLGDVRFEARWDPFHRGLERAYWLTAHVPGGTVLRLGKGSRDDVLRAIAQLEAMLHTARSSER